MRSLFITMLLLFVAVQLKAQVVYEDFYLFQQNNVVSITWTVKSGSLCNGTTIYRKNSGGNDLEVAYIDGICGSDVEDVSYSLIDSEPVLNADNTYYIRFGFSDYSEEKSIYVRYLDPKQLYISPNPTTNTVKLEWNDQFKETYTLEVVNQQGKLVAAYKDVQGSFFILSLEMLPAGLYVVKLTSPNGKELLGKMEKI